jgi:hypothetical protein
MADIDTLIPSSGRIGWWEADTLTSLDEGEDADVWPEKFGNGKDLECFGTPPTFDADRINGLPAVKWDGTQDPLLWSGSGVTLKHAFMIGAYADAAFPASGGPGEYAGMLSGIDNSSHGILTGNPSSAKWFDYNYEAIGDYIFRRRDVRMTESLQESSFSGVISIFEVSIDAGIGLDGVQFGRDRGWTTRKWKGPIVGGGLFDRVLSDSERRDIYEYLAIKYILWKRTSSGLDVWPFEPNWSRPLTVDKPVLSSIAVSRARKSRSKGTRKRGVQLQFEARGPEEYDTAIAFWDAKYPGTSFVYRDDAFSPSRDCEMVFTGGIDQQSNDARDITYGWTGEEV